MSPAQAYANLGAEETAPPSAAAARRLAPLAALFRHQIEAATPVFAWLPREDACVAWLNDPAARAHAASLGVPLFGADPAVVAGCHDKAFAQRSAIELGLEPRPLRGLSEILEPADLADPATFRERLRAALTRWGSVQGEALPRSDGLTLKPRRGTSGRGRVALRSNGDLDRAVAALPRLREAGGVVVEPWLERLVDLSVSLYVDPIGDITLVGSAVQQMTASGACRAHSGHVDARARTTAGVPEEEAMREAAVAVARRAADAGYTGPCGVDGFVFEHAGRRWLRPLVEFNARFTLGFLVAACVREHLGELRRSAGLRPDRPRAFACTFGSVAFAVDSNDAERPTCGPSCIVLDADSAGDSDAAPRLWVGSPEGIARGLAARAS